MIRYSIELIFFFVFLWSIDCTKNEPNLHEKGVVFNDSLYGSSVVRISDKEVDGYSGNGIGNEYAKADAYNCDETYMILRSNDGLFYLYRAADYQLIRNLNELGGGQELEPRWHDTNADILYYLSGSKLMTFNIINSTQTTIHDFSDDFSNCLYITTGTEGDASQDHRYWCFMADDSLFNVIAVCVYDLTTDSVVGIKTSFPDAVNFTTMDASGSHALIGYDSRPFQAFSRDFSQMIEFEPGAMGHGDIALTNDGKDVMVYQNVSTDYISMTDLETGNETQLIAIPFNVNPDIGMHISGNCYTIPGWVLVSTYGAKNPPEGSSHYWMDNLLFMIQLQENPLIVKIAETHCYTGQNPQSNYFAEAFASINRAGTKIVYGSNWGILSPSDYADAYEVSLPFDWNQ